MKTREITPYAALTEPIPSDFNSAPSNSENTSNKGTPRTLRNTSKTSTPSKISKTSKKRNKGVLIPKTYKLPQDLITSIERIAYWRRIKIQDVVSDALRAYIETAQEDDIKPIP